MRVFAVRAALLRGRREAARTPSASRGRFTAVEVELVEKLHRGFAAFASFAHGTISGWCAELLQDLHHAHGDAGGFGAAVDLVLEAASRACSSFFTSRTSWITGISLRQGDLLQRLRDRGGDERGVLRLAPMITPRAMIASISSRAATSCTASGISNAPGTS